MYSHTSRSDQSASGFAFHSPWRRSQSIFLALRREDDCSRRRPATQQSTSDSARFSGVTLRMPQHLSGSRAHSASPCCAACCSSDTPRYTSIEMSYFASSARHVSCVSSNSRSVSSVKKRADGSIRRSMSMITDASFWNEHATYSRGWKRSTAYSSTSSALARSRFGWLVVTATSNRAFALAADDLVRLAAAPVDEVLDVLEVELHGDRELLDLGLERPCADAVHEGVERLAVLAVALVHADPALDGIGHALRGQPHLESGAVGHVAALVAAADVRDVRGHLAAADLHRRAVEPDAAEVMLRAAVRATAHLDVDASRERVLDVHAGHAPLDHAVEAHRAGDAHLAAVGAGAAQDVGDLVRARIAQVELLEAQPEVVERLVADPPEHDVLLDAGARIAAGEVAHDLREPAELRGRQVAADHADLGARESLLALRVHVGLDPAVELAAVAVGRGRRHRQLRGVRLLVVQEQQRVGCVV